jgi:hypothetical protein
LGFSRAGEYVMRPVIDYFNNASCFLLTEPPANILALIPKLMPLQETEHVRLLDVVQDSNGKIVLVLGRTRDACIVWNNVKIEEAQVASNILFRFNGYCFTYSPRTAGGGQIINVGTQPGGNAFLANYLGTRGSTFCQMATMQKSYGAKGFLPIAPMAALLLRTLNEHFMLELRHLVRDVVPRDPVEPGLVMHINEVDPETPKRPLLTHVKATRMVSRPPGCE